MTGEGGEKAYELRATDRRTEEEMLQLVNTKCDALLRCDRSGEVQQGVKDTIRKSSLIVSGPRQN